MYEFVFGNLLIFLTRSGSRNQFDLSVNQNMADNILKLFDVKLSIGDNLDKVISRLSADYLSELKGFKRLAQKVKNQFKRLSIIVLADGLYANDPVFNLCQNCGWNYLFTFKKGCIPQIYYDIQSILSVQQDRFEIERLASKNKATQELIAQKANFITGLEYKKHKVNWVDFDEEIRKEGEDWQEENHFTYLTNLSLSKSNIFEVVQTGRLRWKIENEGFNTQKNSKLALEHKYARSDFKRMKIYYELLQISHMLEQLTLKRKDVREKVKKIKTTVQQLFLDMVAVLRHVVLSEQEVTHTLKLISYG